MIIWFPDLLCHPLPAFSSMIKYRTTGESKVPLHIFCPEVSTSFFQIRLHSEKNFIFRDAFHHGCTTENYTCFNSSQSPEFGMITQRTFYNVSTAFCSDIFRFFPRTSLCSGCSICQCDRLYTHPIAGIISFFSECLCNLIYSLI